MSDLIPKKSLADAVAERLQKQITAGTYKIGDKLPTEPQLMTTYGVGRSTIREAIKITSNLGFLSVQQGIGTFVKSRTGNEPISHRLERANIQELDEVRQILEIKIAEIAALNRTKDDIARINKFLARRDKASKLGLLEECIDADIEFHVAVAEASHNSILSELYQLVARHLEQGFTSQYHDTSNFLRSHSLHDQLAKHIAAKDPKKAYATALKIVQHH